MPRGYHDWTRRRASRITALALLTMTAACGDDPFAPDPTRPGPGKTPAREAVASVQINTEQGQLLVGETVALAATAHGANGQVLTGRAIEWESWDTTVLRVSASGMVTGLRAGAAAVAAKSEGRQGVLHITVREPDYPVAMIGIIEKNAQLVPGTSFHLTAALVGTNNKPIPSHTRVVNWASSDESIISVNSAGLVTARRTGSVTITATSEGKTAEATITVPDFTRRQIGSVDGKPVAQFEQSSFYTDAEGVVRERRVRIRKATLLISTFSDAYRQEWRLEVSERTPGAVPGPWTTEEKTVYDWGTHGYHWLTGEMTFTSQRFEEYGFRTSDTPFESGYMQLRIPGGGPTPHRMYYVFQRYP